MSKYTILQALNATASAQAPIVSVAVGAFGDAATVAITFDAGATPVQKAAAQAAVLAFDWSDAAQASREDAAAPDLATLRDQAQAAFDGNATYLAIGTPTNAQVAAQVRALTQQNQKIIKALAQLVLQAL